MDYIKELEKLLKTDVLVEVNANVKELEEITKKKNNKSSKEELEYMKQVQLYFTEVLEDIEKNLLTQEQALDILEGLEDMKIENQDFWLNYFIIFKLKKINYKNPHNKP